MANFDRANHDREDRDYDGGHDDEENEGSHLPVVIIIAILVLAAFGGVVWLAYNQGVARGRNDVPVRVAAAQGSKADDSGIKVYQQSAGPDEGDDSKAAKSAAPPAAAPAPQAVPDTPAPVQPAPVQPTPKVVAQAAPPPVVAPPPKAQQVVPPKPLPARPAFEDTPSQPQVATRPPAQLGGVHPAAPAPATTPPKTATVTPAPLKPATLKPEAPGAFMLQIGAYKSDEEARGAWKTYLSKHATLLNGFSPDVQQTTHPDGSVWYRLRIASFSNKDTAAALCERLKAQGGACFLAK